MSGYTPGPWRVDGLAIQATDGNVALVNLARSGKADARLIAAAPELLAACKAVMADGVLDRPSISACDAAIAKAEGR